MKDREEGKWKTGRDKGGQEGEGGGSSKEEVRKERGGRERRKRCCQGCRNLETRGCSGLARDVDCYQGN